VTTPKKGVGTPLRGHIGRDGAFSNNKAIYQGIFVRIFTKNNIAAKGGIRIIGY